jgi:hypothetical protein
MKTVLGINERWWWGGGYRVTAVVEHCVRSCKQVWRIFNKNPKPSCGGLVSGVLMKTAAGIDEGRFLGCV